MLWAASMIAMVAASSSGEESKLPFALALLLLREDDESPSPFSALASSLFVVDDEPYAGVLTLPLEDAPKPPPFLSRCWERERNPAVSPMRRRLGLNDLSLLRLVLVPVRALPVLELGVPIVVVVVAATLSLSLCWKNVHNSWRYVLVGSTAKLSLRSPPDAGGRRWAGGGGGRAHAHGHGACFL